MTVSRWDFIADEADVLRKYPSAWIRRRIRLGKMTRTRKGNEFPQQPIASYNGRMTLLDAPRYDARKARIRRNIIIGIIVAIPFVAFFTWYYWNWPEEHRVDKFFHAIEAKDYSQAYGLWNSDPNWKQHPDQYKLYPFSQFMSDWGPSSEYGVITNAKILVSKEYGSGVIIGARINGNSKPLFLWVEKKSKSIGFSPVDLRF